MSKTSTMNNFLYIYIWKQIKIETCGLTVSANSRAVIEEGEKRMEAKRMHIKRVDFIFVLGVCMKSIVRVNHFPPILLFIVE
jgi:hypothetical protein